VSAYTVTVRQRRLRKRRTRRVMRSAWVACGKPTRWPHRSQRRLVTDMHPGMGLSNTWQIPAISYIEHCQIGGCWIRVGPQIESWIGYTAEQSSVPNFWKTCLHPDDKDRVLAEDERCERTLEPWGNTYRFIARDGRTSSRSRPTTPGSRPWSPRSPSTASPDGSWAARPLSRSASSGPSSGIPSRDDSTSSPCTSRWTASCFPTPRPRSWRSPSRSSTAPARL
jgi:PAS domain-containing protein